MYFITNEGIAELQKRQIRQDYEEYLKNIKKLEEYLAKHKEKPEFFSNSEDLTKTFHDKPKPVTDSQKIEAVFDGMKELVLEKNRRYGNIALHPANVFSGLSGEEGIRQRIDDKLSRIKNSDELRKNDVADLMGYLCLLMVEKDWTNLKDLID